MVCACACACLCVRMLYTCVCMHVCDVCVCMWCVCVCDGGAHTLLLAPCPAKGQSVLLGEGCELMFGAPGKLYGGKSDELASPSVKQSELNLCNHEEGSGARKDFRLKDLRSDPLQNRGLTLLLPQGDPLQNRVSF